MAATGRDDRGGQFGHRSPHGHHRQADDPVAEPEGLGQPDSALHEEVAAEEEEAQSRQGDQAQAARAASRRGPGDFRRGFGFRRVRQGLHDLPRPEVPVRHPGGIDNGASEEHSRLPAVHLSIPQHPPERHGGRQQHGDLPPDQRAVHWRWPHKKGHAQDETQIRDVRADHIADGEPAVSRPGALDAHDEFRG
ncbi:MAG: hypothetical protein IPL96_10170 [Holophagaceae bacterium]|nr:hypothetical protein [Holophagaceae bacterium]